MSQASSLVLQFVRCNAPGRADEWPRWLEAVHHPDPTEAPGRRAATGFGLRVQPGPDLRGHSVVHVHCNDPRRDALVRS